MLSLVLVRFLGSTIVSLDLGHLPLLESVPSEGAEIGEREIDGIVFERLIPTN